MALTPLPPAPSIDDPENFAAEADAFVAALGQMVTELNTIIGTTIPAGSAAASTLTGNTLAANVVTSSLTTVGTLAVLSVAGNITVTGGTITTAAATSLSLATALGIQFKAANTGDGTNWIQVSGANANGQCIIRATGGDASVGIDYYAKGGDGHNFYTDDGAAVQFSVAHTASSARRIIATGSAAGNPSLAPSAGDLAITGNINISGSLTKGSGTFDIEHPLDSARRLRHSFIEGPRFDLIYRGRATLKAGRATVDLDRSGANPMTPGTFEALTRDPDVWLSRADCAAKVSGATVTITATDPASTATVSWLVIAERRDQHVMEGAGGLADKRGHLVLEYAHSSEFLKDQAAQKEAIAHVLKRDQIRARQRAHAARSA